MQVGLRGQISKQKPRPGTHSHRCLSRLYQLSPLSSIVVQSGSSNYMTSTTGKGSKSNRGNCVWRNDVNDATRQAKPGLAVPVSTTSNLAQRRLMSTMVSVCHNLPSVSQTSMFA